MSSVNKRWPEVFEIAVSNVAGWLELGPAVAAARCGAVGVLNLQRTPQEEAALAIKRAAQLVKTAPGRLAIKLQAHQHWTADFLRRLPPEFDTVLLCPDSEQRLRTLLKEGVPSEGGLERRRFFLEVTCASEAAIGERLGFAGLVAKGNEAGGFVGEESTFVLLQRLLSEFSLPVWAFGGIGLHTAPACYAAGAAGILLDSQVLLTPESKLPHAVRTQIERLEGDDTVCLGREAGALFRTPKRQCSEAIASVKLRENELAGESTEEPRALWRAELEKRAGFQAEGECLWPVGQDACFAASLAKRFHNVSGIVGAFRTSIAEHVSLARQQKSLGRQSALALEHSTTYPILQGPMTRVSDRAEFAHAVAEAGGLPFLALALLRKEQARTLLEETSRRLGSRAWGVGILGFVPADLRAEQLEAVSEIRPKFAIIAGGRPDQALGLEQQGISTYLHVPAPGLLQSYLQDGARSFVFEGRECGGHVGPRTSFVLWNEMVDVLLSSIQEGVRGEELRVVFAGGIHDGRSAAMVAALAAPLVAKGVKIGVLMGTAYLFTTEAVSSGAIVPTFQQQALICKETVILESGVGHATRCVDTPFAKTFAEHKRELIARGETAEKVRSILENLNVGRLRIAAKGVDRAPDGTSNGAARYVSVQDSEQFQEGMYMIGQLAALRTATCTMRDLHEDVSEGSSRVLASVQEPELPAADRPRWAQQPCDVAIIGLSCHLPQAPDVETFWSNIVGKVQALEDVGLDRFDAGLYFDEDRSAKDGIYSKRGGFLKDTGFDPIRYGIPPNALASIDPFQLLMLAAVDKALEDAGYQSRAFPRERTSVIFGFSGGLGELGVNYAVRAMLPKFAQTPPEILDRLPEWTEDSFAGLLPNVGPGRVANRFDLGGVNFAVDAACASSLAAIYVAARELVAGDSDMVVTGGIDTGQNPFGYLCFSKSQALSGKGKCSTFDQEADGTAISEGVSVVVLKRLSDAERDGDRIYAVLKGIAGSSDGRGRSMTAPRSEGQSMALRRAYEQAGIRPSKVGLIEAHGTGTVAGDSAELAALTEVFTADGAGERSCAVGSVKSMIGHTKAAAGVTGLLKIALSLHHRILPPTLNLAQPNSQLLTAGTPFYANTEAKPWLANGTPRCAGVSAFGFGGTNFHAVLEEYQGSIDHPLDRAPTPVWPVELFLWSASSQESLLSVLRDTAHKLAEAPSRLTDLASSVCDRYGHSHEPAFRLAIVASSLDDLLAKIEAAGKLVESGRSELNDPQKGIYLGSGQRVGRLAFLFPGQGSQYTGMLRDLAVRFGEFNESLSSADEELSSYYGTRLSNYIYPPPAFDEAQRKAQSEALTDTAVAQAALGTVEIAAHKLLKRLGVSPDMTAGHSYGEYVALCASGAISEDALFRLSAARGHAINSETGGDRGAMAAVPADAESVTNHIKDIEGVVVANRNSRRQTVIAGTTSAVQAAVASLEAAGFHSRSIDVSCAFHSPLMRRAAQRFAVALASESFETPGIPVFSNTTAMRYPADPVEIRSILTNHLVSCVRFIEEVDAMYQEGARVFLEVGPKGVLSALVRQILADRPGFVLQIDPSQRQGLDQFLQTLGHLWAMGVSLNTAEIFRGRVKEHLDLTQPVSKAVEPAWMLNPARIFRRDAPAPRRDRLTWSASTAVTPNNQTPIFPAASNSTSGGTSPLPQMIPLQTIPSVVPGDGVDTVMLQFQQLMSQFLQTQATMMSAYLQGSTSPLSSSTTLAPVQPLQPVQAPSPAAAPARTEQNVQTTLCAPSDVGRDFIAVVSSRTGYPVEMLSLHANIEADLGIDSIKRMEILAEFRRQATASAQEGIRAVMDRLTSAPTLGSIIDQLSAVINPASGTSPASPSTSDIGATLLKVVSERTGYPTEMLSLDASIEADLGIDSIKKAEIVAAFRKQSSAAEQTAVRSVTERLTGAKTFSEMIAHLSEALQPPAAERPAATREKGVGRFRLTTVDAAREAAQADPAPGRISLITDDETGIAEGLCKELAAKGERPILLRHGTKPSQLANGIRITDLASPKAIESAVEDVRRTFGCISAVVHLVPLREHPHFTGVSAEQWQRLVHLDIRSLYALVRSAFANTSDAGIPQDALLLTVTARGGDFGLHRPGSASPTHYGAADFVKTAAVELDGVSCKIVDVDPAEGAPLICRRLADELLSADRSLQVGLNGDRRIGVAVNRDFLEDSDPDSSITADSVFLLTGGARGITAEIAQAIARRYQPSIVLVGSSPAPAMEEPLDIAQLDDGGAIRSALLARAKAEGTGVKPADIEAAYQRVKKNREIRSNIAKLRQAGARVEYHQVDVRDLQAFAHLIDGIYAEHKRLDVVIHGAGIIEDKLIRDKTPDSFDRVVHTKADSAYVLAKKVRFDAIKRVIFMSSISAAFGNRGQADYAAANGIMNGIATFLASEYPGRVASLNFGPWDQTGMVSDIVREQFAARGIKLIGVEEGVDLVLRVAETGVGDSPILIVGDGPWSETAVERPSVRAVWGGQ